MPPEPNTTYEGIFDIEFSVNDIRYISKRLNSVNAGTDNQSQSDDSIPKPLKSVDAVDHQQAASSDGDDISESTSGSGRVLINPCMINKFDIIQKWLQYCPNFEKLYQLHEGTLNNFTFFNILL